MVHVGTYLLDVRMNLSSPTFWPNIKRVAACSPHIQDYCTSLPTHQVHYKPIFRGRFLSQGAGLLRVAIQFAFLGRSTAARQRCRHRFRSGPGSGRSSGWRGEEALLECFLLLFGKRREGKMRVDLEADLHVPSQHGWFLLHQSTVLGGRELGGDGVGGRTTSLRAVHTADTELADSFHEVFHNRLGIGVLSL